VADDDSQIRDTVLAEAQNVMPERFEGDFPIRIRGLGNAFGEQVIHENLELDVRKGEILGVVGGSGTGKSVLMRSVIGLQRPVAGTIEVFGQDTANDSPADEISLRSRWGVLFQGGALFSTLTVGENVQVPLKEFYPELTQELLDEIARYKVVLAGLPQEAASKYPNELSGGMVKRAALARALSLDPQLLFLDEPTAGLDPIAAAKFDTLIRELSDTLDLTVFLITHDLDTLWAICDRVAVLADKRVIAVGTIPELLRSDHPWIQEYFNGPRARAAQGTHARATGQVRDQGTTRENAPPPAGQDTGLGALARAAQGTGADIPPTAVPEGKALDNSRGGQA
jgi:phospholipid/cholesterol/gamma-HCH transport system ATP-binding protein